MTGQPDSPAGLSFERDVRPMFRERDRDSMLKAFDLWSHSDVRTHQDAILERLRNGTMPCDGAWPRGASRRLPALDRRRFRVLSRSRNPRHYRRAAAQGHGNRFEPHCRGLRWGWDWNWGRDLRVGTKGGKVHGPSGLGGGGGPDEASPCFEGSRAMARMKPSPSSPAEMANATV